MAKTIENGKTFGKQCDVNGREGRFWLVRRGRNESRVAPVREAHPENYEGELVKTADLANITEFEVPTPADEPVAEAPAAETAAS